ncbi:hypothetical protein, partial [Nocardioides sp.]|uniref:hypothetical protein n=1 Tax=Nocardioides sp. TaxID=35761 RepID=UPI00198119EE
RECWDPAADSRWGACRTPLTRRPARPPQPPRHATLLHRFGFGPPVWCAASRRVVRDHDERSLTVERLRAASPASVP